MRHLPPRVVIKTFDYITLPPYFPPIPTLENTAKNRQVTKSVSPPWRFLAPEAGSQKKEAARSPGQPFQSSMRERLLNRGAAAGRRHLRLGRRGRAVREE